MVLTVSFVLSPVTGLFCHRRPRIKVLSKPGWADATSANLTPASGRQDHTTSPYAATSLVRSLGDRSQAFRQPALQSRRAQNAAASTASLPASVTITSGGVGWREFVEMICPTGEAKYFCKGDSTQNCLTGKSPAGANGSRECAPDDKLSEKAEPSHANRERAHGGYRGPARSRIAARRTQGQRTVQIAWCAGPAHRDLGRL